MHFLQTFRRSWHLHLVGTMVESVVSVLYYFSMNDLAFINQNIYKYSELEWAIQWVENTN